MPINYATGSPSGSTGETPTADGQADSAPVDMSAAAQQAADAALGHAEAEGRKVAMAVQPAAE